MRLAHYDLSAGFLRCYVSIAKGANDRFPETQKHNMKASKKSETAAFTFAPFQEAQAQLSNLIGAIEARSEVNVKQIRAQWGFSLLIPFAKQWESVSDKDKARIRKEAFAQAQAVRPQSSEATLNRAVLALGFRVRERESDPLAQAKAFLKSAAKAFHTHGVSQSDWMAAAAQARAVAETKEA